MAVVGLILLIGLVAIASIGILTYAGASTTDVQQEMENERIEGAFVELSQTMSTTAATRDTTEMIDFAAGDYGAVVKKDTGSIHISGGGVEKELNIGAIEYEGDDGTRIAYQAGGVFRETGEETQVVSAPPLHYDETAETLTFPVTTVSGDTELDSNSVLVSHEFTNSSRTDPIQGDIVTIEITSQYYRGWEAYFERQAGENAIHSSEAINDTHGVVVVKLGERDIENVFEYAAATVNNFTVDGAAGSIYGDVLSGGEVPDENNFEEGVPISNASVEIPSINDTVASMIDDESSYDALEITGGQIQAGRYYVENYDEGSTDFDVSDGNISLVVGGNLDTDGITVTGTESGNAVYVYMNGEFDIGSGNTEICVEECDKDNPQAKHFQVYGGDDFNIEGESGTPVFEGLIYAPSASINPQGNINFHGSLVVDEINAGGNIDIVHDPDLKNVELAMDPDGQIPPNITYLNIVKHEVNVTSD